MKKDKDRSDSKHIKQLQKRKKKILKLKKNHLIGSIFSIVVISALAYLMSVTFVMSFLVSILEADVEDAYKMTKFMADVYDGLETDTGSKDAIKGSIPEGRDFFVTNGDGEVVLQKGVYTVDKSRPSTNATAYYGSSERVMTFYADMDSPEGMENPLKLENDPWKLLKTLYEQTFFSANISVGETEGDEADIEEIRLMHERDLYQLIDSDKMLVRYHYWLSVPLSDGESSFCKRSEVTIMASQVMMPIALMVVYVLLMAVLLIIVIVNIVTLTVSKNRMSKMYFTDIVTKGHNQYWFDIMGEKYLSSKKNAHSRCAVLNIFFANYRNLCVSMNPDDAEEMLRDVYGEIARTFGKKGCYAHCTASNFAVAVNASNETALRSQLPLVITELENLSKEHRLCFQIGVDFIEKLTTPHGLVLRRDFADISAHYGNACTARETLGESDESGIAYYDEKLVEEQRWINTVNENQLSALTNEEFLVYYQPKYDPRTNVLRGAEALIRWQSPEFGFVTPNRMIPIFEKNGFITEIDHYMITHVARDQKRWLDAGYKCVPVSVNVSRAHFIESDLAEQIRDSVDKEGAPHELIEIELTESAFFDDKKMMISTISRLKSYGFSVSMDDFGAGYSSLNSLKDMPLDVLKLDAEFFRGRSENGRGEIVVSEAIKLAKNLNMRTVAEGVEIKEQVDFLAGQGCDMIQGYYYSKPIPSDDFEERMKLGVSLPEASEDSREPAAPDAAAQPAAEGDPPQTEPESAAEAAPEAAEAVKE